MAAQSREHAGLQSAAAMQQQDCRVGACLRGAVNLQDEIRAQVLFLGGCRRLGSACQSRQDEEQCGGAARDYFAMQHGHVRFRDLDLGMLAGLLRGHDWKSFGRGVPRLEAGVLRPIFHRERFSCGLRAGRLGFIFTPFGVVSLGAI
ncbi:MAG: hypothetical protein WDZ84_06195 [Rhodovibrionaceae bacterium]